MKWSPISSIPHSHTYSRAANVSLIIRRYALKYDYIRSKTIVVSSDMSTRSSSTPRSTHADHGPYVFLYVRRPKMISFVFCGGCLSRMVGSSVKAPMQICVQHTMQDPSAFLRCLWRNSIEEGLEVAQQPGPDAKTRSKRFKSVTDSSPTVAVDCQ